MIVYIKSAIESIKIGSMVKLWSDKKLILSSTPEKISSIYKNDLYISNIFIRIALFLFALIIIGFSLGFITLISIDASSKTSTIVRLIIYALLTLGALEFFIKEKKLYRAGSDDAMLYSGLGLLFSAIFLMVENYEDEKGAIIRFLLIALPILVIAAIRYVDMLVTATAFVALFALVFFLCDMAGKTVMAFVPFAGMLLSFGIYFMTRKLKTKEYLAWWDNLVILEILSLFCFYLSGNYFVVRELSIALLDVEVSEGKDIPFAFVFYAFTVLVPLAYLYKSYVAKDRILMRCGLIIVALSVLTFKYYYSLGHHEITLTVAGAFMIALAWFFMKHLKSPKYGLSSEHDDSILNTDIEAIIVTESFSHASPDSGVKFGGGSSGGGGASGDY